MMHTETHYQGSKTPHTGAQGNQYQVLVASRSAPAMQRLAELVTPAQDITVTTRHITNGHADPLYGLDSLPDLLIFRLGEDWHIELEELSARPAHARPPVLIVSPQPDPTAMRQAMQAGARDFFVEPVVGEDLVRAVEQLCREALDRHDGVEARLSVVMNAKGGSGASLIAANCAHMLAEIHARKVALLDLDLQFGALTHYLDLALRHGIKEALDNIEDLDAAALEGYLAKHPSGLRVMGPESDRLILTDEVSPERLNCLLDLLAWNHHHLVVDLPRQIDLVTSTVLDRADQVVVVLQQSITHLRDAARLMNVLRDDLEISDEKLVVAVNRYEPGALIRDVEIEKALAHQGLVLIPNDFKRVVESINDGVPLYSVSRRAPVTRSLQQLSNVMKGEGGSAGEGLFGRLFARLKGA